MRKLFIILLILVITSLTSCADLGSIISRQKIVIMKDNVLIEELDVIVGDSFNLSTNLSSTSDLVWTSSNKQVVTVDMNGNVDVLSKGQVVLSVTVKDTPYITDSIYVSSSNKVEQTGVGSGTKDDPIFLGNEGEDEPIEVYFLEMQHIYADSLFIKKGNVEILIDAGWEYDGNYVFV